MDNLTWKPSGSSPQSTTSTVRIRTTPKCDFWCTLKSKKTDGHFGYTTVSGDFRASVSFKGQYEAQYDQAGLMIYFNEEHWLKAGIELINGVPHISAVVTKPFSDWSIVPLTSLTSIQNETVHISVVKKGRQLLVDYYVDSLVSADSDEHWRMVRKVNGFFGEYDSHVEVGLMAASPQSTTGFDVEFMEFHIDNNV